MKKALNKKGQNIFVVTVKSPVSSDAFAIALSEYFYEKKIDFNGNLSKKD